jgi:hypothetical protein
MPQVDMLVWTKVLPDLAGVLAILKANEVARAPEDELATRVRIDMPYVPEGATLVTPNLQHTPDGVRVQSLSWTYAD